jgi:hypothetical protein
MDMESEEPKTTINLCQLMPVNFSIRVDRGEFNKLHHLLYHQWSLWQYSEKELWFLQTWNLMTCKLTKLCMEKLLQVAELGGSNGQRNFSCMDIFLTLASVQIPVHFFPWIMAGMISRNLQEVCLFSFFWSRDSLAEWSHGKDMAICTFSGM